MEGENHYIKQYKKRTHKIESRTYKTSKQKIIKNIKELITT